MSYLCIRNAKILTLGILKTSFSLHSLNRIFAIEITNGKVKTENGKLHWYQVFYWKFLIPVCISAYY